MDGLPRRAKILLGLATLLPFAYQPVFMRYMLNPYAHRMEQHDFAGMMRIFALFMPIHGLVVLLVMGVLVFFLVHAFTSARITGRARTIWAVALFLGNMLVMPFYWYFNIWREPTQSAVSSEQ